MSDPNSLPELLAPPGTVLGDQQRRAILERELAHVAKLTLILAGVTRFIPGVPGLIAAGVIAGVEKSPESGRVRPGPHTAANALPSPFGFLDPTAVGLPRNYYLPNGVTEYVPPIVDQIGIGLPQQRVEDEQRRLILNTNAQTSRLLTAARRVEGESDEVLNDIINGNTLFTRAGVIVATAEVPLIDLQNAARDELNRGSILAALPQVVNGVVAPTPTANGPDYESFVMGRVALPVLLLAAEAARRAPELLQQLASERADP